MEVCTKPGTIQSSSFGKCSGRLRERWFVLRISWVYGTESVRRWVADAEIDAGDAPGTSGGERTKIKNLEQEDRELRRANEILKRASVFVNVMLVVSGWVRSFLWCPAVGSGLSRDVRLAQAVGVVGVEPEGLWGPQVRTRRRSNRATSPLRCCRFSKLIDDRGRTTSDVAMKWRSSMWGTHGAEAPTAGRAQDAFC